MADVSPSDLAGPPPSGTAVPEIVQRLARRAGAEIEPVWLNGLGGLTYRLVAPDGVRYVKWSSPGAADLAQEAERLRWAGRFSPVPRVLAVGEDASGAWLVTAALAGRSAVESPWRDRPATAARAIGAGLRRLHEALPVAGCPWSWSVGERLAAAVHTDEGRRSALLRDAPPLDPVVCHGDACAPNTLIADDGGWAGHVDLGALGVADRWADLAVAAWSTEWNYGPGVDGEVYAGYGIEPDERKIAYYRELWDAS